MPKKETFIQYWRENIETARDGYEMIILIIFLVWQAVFFGCKSYGIDSETLGLSGEKTVDIINGFAAGAFLILGLLWIPYKRHEKEKSLECAEIESLKTKLGTGGALPLKVLAKTFAGYNHNYIAGLEITNPNQAINGFSVRLREMEPNLLPADVYLPDIAFPSHGTAGDVLKSGQTVRIDIFHAKRSGQTRVEFVATYDERGRIAAGWVTSPREDKATSSYADLILTFEITGIGIRMQREKLKASFPKSDNQPVIFQITTAEAILSAKQEAKSVDLERKQAAEKAVEKLTGFATVFLQRITAIKAIQPNEYNSDKDNVLWDANAAAVAYIVLNLNAEAGKVYDSGVAEINTTTVRKDGVGSTIYQDDHRTVLAKFHRRVVNIKQIIDDIEKYLKTPIK